MTIFTFSATRAVIDLSSDNFRLARIARLLNKAIFWTVIALLPVSAVAGGEYAPGTENIFVSVIFILGALWIIEAVISRDWHLIGSRLVLPIIGIVIIASIQTVSWFGPAREVAGIEIGPQFSISADPFETKLFILNLLGLVLFYQLLGRYVSNQGRLLVLVSTIVGVGLVSALVGLGHHISQHGLLSSDHLAQADFGQFPNRNHFAFLMELTFGFVLGWILIARRRGMFLTGMLAAGILGVALVLTNSRGGALSMGAQTLGFLLWVFFISLRTPSVSDSNHFLRLPRFLTNSFSRRLAICLVIALAIGTILIGGAAKRLSSVPEELRSQDVAHRNYTRRLEIWRSTLKLITANAIIGVGFGAYETAIPTYHDATGEFDLKQAHNDYLELIAAGGLLSLAMGIWFVITLINRARIEFFRIEAPVRRVVFIGALTGLIGVVIHSLVDFGLHIFVNAIICTALVALISTRIGSDGESPSLSRSKSLENNSRSQSAFTYVMAVTCLVLFLSGAWMAFRAGLSRSVSGADNLNWNRQAIRLTPDDPIALYCYARALVHGGQLSEASQQYEQAIVLRPRDYRLWMELGQVRELEGKYNLAFESLSEAVLQAPYYAEPHWQLGELFVKLGRRSDAIREFSLAVKSNPELVMPPDVFFRTAAVGEAAPLN